MKKMTNRTREMSVWKRKRAGESENSIVSLGLSLQVSLVIAVNRQMQRGSFLVFQSPPGPNWWILHWAVIVAQASRFFLIVLCGCGSRKEKRQKFPAQKVK